MNINDVRIVLVATSHPGNIGSAARAMKAMGLSRLYLVAPSSFPDKVASALAVGADDILQGAIVTDCLSAAISDCHLVIATSARRRDLELQCLSPREMAATVATHADNTEVAIVFGREHAGLTNDELLQAHFHVTIPSVSTFSSLNLAQAVQVIAYELRMCVLDPVADLAELQENRATMEEIEQFHAHLRDVLIAIDFLKPSNPRKLLQRLRRLFNRAQLEHVEVNILRGFLTQVQATINKNNGALSHEE